MSKHTISVGLIALSILLAGCHMQGSPITTATAWQTPIAPLPTADPPTPTQTPTPTPGVTEKQTGYVRKAYTRNGKNCIDIDYVQFLTGAAAVEAAKKDGEAYEGEDGIWRVDNDYYIVNDSKKIRTFEVGAFASIKVLINADETLTSVTFAKFTALGPTFVSGRMLMDCSVVNGVVTALEEVFLP